MKTEYSLEDREAAMQLALDEPYPVQTYRELVGCGQSIAELKSEDACFIELTNIIRQRNQAVVS